MRYGNFAFTPHAACALLACASAAHAQVVIPTSQNVGAISQGVGSGLNGFYYGQPVQETNALADAYIAANPAVATFASTVIDYPGGNTFTSDSTTLATFLGADAATLSNPGVGANTLAGQLFHFTGYLAVATPGTFAFTLNSDDGSRLNIGGVTLADNGGIHSYGGPTNSAQFATAGLYALDLIYYENDGVTGVALFSDITGSTGLLPNNLLFRNVTPAAVPEPDSLALLMGMTITGLGFLRRRKQTQNPA